jgi:hypothetical protein
LTEDVVSHRKCTGRDVTFYADAGHGQGKGKVIPLHIFAMGLKNNAEEYCTWRMLYCPQWLAKLLDVPRFSCRISAFPQGHGDPCLVSGVPLGALAQGGLGSQQP